MRIAEVLSQVRRLQNISQRDVAKKIGVQQATVAQYEAGTPAIGAEKLRLLCDILSVDEKIFDGENYLFKPGALVKFYVRGLKTRFQPLTWLDLLLKYTEKLKILLLIKAEKGDVSVVCAKDNRGSVFLIFIEVPLTWKEVFDYVEKYPGKGKVLIRDFSDIVPEDFLDNRLYGSWSQKLFSYLETQEKKYIEDMIDKAFAGILSEEESNLILLLRKKKVPVESVYTTDSQAMSVDEKEVVPGFLTQVLDKEELKEELLKFSELLDPIEYSFMAGRERVNVQGMDIIVLRIPVGMILKDVLKYLSYSKDEKLKASMCERIVAFYHWNFLKDFSENSYQKDLQRAFDNFRISFSDEKAHEEEDRPDKDKNNSPDES